MKSGLNMSRSSSGFSAANQQWSHSPLSATQYMGSNPSRQALLSDFTRVAYRPAPPPAPQASQPVSVKTCCQCQKAAKAGTGKQQGKRASSMAGPYRQPVALRKQLDQRRETERVQLATLRGTASRTMDQAAEGANPPGQKADSDVSPARPENGRRGADHSQGYQTPQKKEAIVRSGNGKEVKPPIAAQPSTAVSPMATSFAQRGDQGKLNPVPVFPDGILDKDYGDEASQAKPKCVREVHVATPLRTRWHELRSDSEEEEEESSSHSGVSNIETAVKGDEGDSVSPGPGAEGRIAS